MQQPITQHAKFETPMHAPSMHMNSNIDQTSLMDWVNSFDDPYCVLVSSVPEDLANGIVLSHVVGFIACSQSDREKIFDLVNYPK